MGGFVEQQLQKAVTALVEGDSSLGEAVAMDDYKVNDMEVSIDEECSRILATRAPAAGDLRLIVAIIKTITDLERIGDEGEKVGYIASRLARLSAADNSREIKSSGCGLRDGPYALEPAAWTGTRRQERARRLSTRITIHSAPLLTFMMEDPRTIAARRRSCGSAALGACDHAKNIGEYVIELSMGGRPHTSSMSRARAEGIPSASRPAAKPRGTPGAHLT